MSWAEEQRPWGSNHRPMSTTAEHRSTLVSEKRPAPPDCFRCVFDTAVSLVQRVQFGNLFRANLEVAGRFSPLVRRFEDFGGILKVNPLYPEWGKVFFFLPTNLVRDVKQIQSIPIPSIVVSPTKFRYPSVALSN